MDAELRGEERGLEPEDLGDDLIEGRVEWSRERRKDLALLGARHVASGLVLESAELGVGRDGVVAAVPVDRRAAEREVNGRHHATPVHESGEVREPVRVLHGDQVPLPEGAGVESAAPAEDTAAQQRAIRGPAPLDGGEVSRPRVVGVQRVEDGVRAAGLVEQPLQGTGVDAPGFFRDVARATAAAVATLSLEVLADEIDEAFPAERRRVSARVLDREVVGEAGRLCTQRVVRHPPQAEDQRNRRDLRSQAITPITQP
jgi:hypothetical protein